MLFENCAALLVGGDDSGEFLNVGILVGGESDLADGVGAGVVEDIVLDGAGAFVGSEAEIEFDGSGDFVDGITGWQFDENAGGNQLSFHWLKRDRAWDICFQIHTGSIGSCICG